MTLTVDLKARKHYLRATVSGTYSLRAAQDVYDRAVKTAVASGHSRVLIDASSVTGVPTQDERYMLGLFVAAEQRILAAQTPPREVQVAVLAHRPLADPDRFAETVAVNRGAKVKVSERLDEALAWLGVSASC
jgi:DNA-binding NarL/FixJ family response regulator